MCRKCNRKLFLLTKIREHATTNYKERCGKAGYFFKSDQKNLWPLTSRSLRLRLLSSKISELNDYWRLRTH